MKTNNMESIIENLINGNIKDAKRMAKRWKECEIEEDLIEAYGWTIERASLAAALLKGADVWQKYCDAK